MLPGNDVCETARNEYFEKLRTSELKKNKNITLRRRNKCESHCNVLVEL